MHRVISAVTAIITELSASFVLQNLVRLWNELQGNSLLPRQVTLDDHVPFEVQTVGCMNAWLCYIGKSSVSERNDKMPDSVSAERPG